MDPSAAYQVVARRYRPQRFADLVGQERVARGLSGAITSGRIGHAYLFTGARGVGKTSAARIFAKALECAAGPAPEPCNACEACGEIAAGQDIDVVEIDAASNRGIDEMRQLRQNVAVRPARDRFKIYIIDEVHMLTREAFNALLKTLEEPPGHVKFVLCTTEPDKLPITILSRCQRFDFTVVETAAIAGRLAAIAASEGAEVSARALDLIARRAAGSMRDSQSLLEQLLGSASGPIDVAEVHALIGTGPEERIGALVAAILARDAAAALVALETAVRGGADPAGVLEQLMAALRECLLGSVGCGPDLLGRADDIGLDLAGAGRRLGTATVLAMLQVIDQALARMQSSGRSDLLTEMAIVRLARLEDLDSLADAVAAVAAGAAAGARPPVPMSEPRAERRPGPQVSDAPNASASVSVPSAPSRSAAVKLAKTELAKTEPVKTEPVATGEQAPTAQVQPARRKAARSQAALLREAAGHPLVTTARDLFDAAIRRVDPPRQPPADAGFSPAAEAPGPAAEAAGPGSEPAPPGPRDDDRDPDGDA